MSPNLPLVLGDHQSLFQVFLNLARNIKTALGDCQYRQLRITAGQEHDLVVVRFYDTGPGVARPDELFQAFQPWAHSSGLGLYISRAILRAHGGNLYYKPQPAGSCFAAELFAEEHVSRGDARRASTT
jgi:two-component system, LuxR family, sensor kinase FixL